MQNMLDARSIDVTAWWKQVLRHLSSTTWKKFTRFQNPIRRMIKHHLNEKNLKNRSKESRNRKNGRNATAFHQQAPKKILIRILKKMQLKKNLIKIYWKNKLNYSCFINGILISWFEYFVLRLLRKALLHNLLSLLFVLNLKRSFPRRREFFQEWTP